jgi:hypothetical protein
MKHDAQERLERVIQELTDFQRATVEVVSKRFIGKRGLRGRMLVADEVGLGKTVVAKGVIASLLLHRLHTGVKRPLRVVYICSNLALAQENAHKLAVFKDKDAERWTRKLEFGRLAELGVQQDAIPAGVLVEICSLTPATSFTLTQGGGNARERHIIWRALRQVPYMDATPALLAFFKDNVEGAWNDADSWFDSRSLEPTTLREFAAKMGRQPDLSDEAMATARENGLSCRSWRTLLRDVADLSTRSALSKQQGQLIRLTRTRIREMFVESCACNLQADLFILDEFQRFSDLVTGDAARADDDEATEEKRITEQQIVARRVLHEGEVYATLLLSATPFKALSHTADEDEGNAHATELEELLKYLTRADATFVTRYRSGRDALFSQMLGLPEGRLRPGSLDREPKRLVEALLRAYICRTERTAVESDIERIFHNVDAGCAVPSVNEIQEFICLDKLAETLNHESGGLVHTDIMKFHKAAPWCLSFLSGYQLRDNLQRYRDQPQVAAAIKATSSAWIPYEKLNAYQANLTRNAPSKRFQAVLEAAAPVGAEKLLWVPPAMPYYGGSGPYAGRDGFSKTLLFSSLVLTPRALSALVSYECERRLIPANKRKGVSYFNDSRDNDVGEDGKGNAGRKDRAWAFRFDEGAHSPGWSLVYPSKRLSSILIPNRADSLTDLRTQVRGELVDDFRKLTARFAKGTPIRGAAWYTLAPVLLDWLSDKGRNHVQAWKAAMTTPSRSSATQTSHAERLLELTARDQIELGPAPDDLLDYLVDLAIAGPAVCLMRSLDATWPTPAAPADPAPAALLKLATGAALAFVHKMNRIESQRVLRAVCGKDKPWMAVAKYAAMGNLQAVIDEYLHMLKSVHGTMKDSVDAFSAVLATGAVSVTAQRRRAATKDVRFHCHYAVPLGNQKSTDEKGISRITNARAAFNSPFWPFMLNSTSIGQEGLDFHWYCRRIVHWNLPSNPIDLEQREGRINRYKSLVVRQRVADTCGKNLRLPKHGDVWSALFERATSKHRKTDLVPFWHFPLGSTKIERFVPAMPFSADVSRLDEILRILSLYRLSFGQPRQQELVENLLKRELTAQELAEIRDALLIDLAPVSYQPARSPITRARRFGS